MTMYFLLLKRIFSLADIPICE